MKLSAVLLLFLFISAAVSQSPTAGAEQPATHPCSDAASKPVSTPETVELRGVKRIFVESFGDDVTSKEMQSMIVSSLVNTKRFTVTENRLRADAILKGVALEKTSHEVHAYGEGTSVGAAAGAHSSNINGSVYNGNGSISGSSSGGFGAQSMGINDSSLNTETVNEARVAVRLVNSDGDVIWTTTQESKGAKYKGATADVADMCVKQLLRDIAKLDANTASAVDPASHTSK